MGSQIDAAAQQRPSGTSHAGKMSLDRSPAKATPATAAAALPATSNPTVLRRIDPPSRQVTVMSEVVEYTEPSSSVQVNSIVPFSVATV